jgi:hypothetical protein
LIKKIFKLNKMKKILQKIKIITYNLQKPNRNKEFNKMYHQNVMFLLKKIKIKKPLKSKN